MHVLPLLLFQLFDVGIQAQVSLGGGEGRKRSGGGGGGGSVVVGFKLASDWLKD